MIFNVPKIDLTFDKVIIFTGYIPAMKDYLMDFWQSLSVQEKDQTKKFLNNDLKDKYIVSHGFLRYLLSSYIDTAPQNISYSTNQFGKPFLKDGRSRVQFNMSHSKDCVVYSLTLDNQVGIDIEWKNKDINLEEIANLVLTTTEEALYKKLDKEEKFQTFYRTWTRKEAIIKAIGLGLSYPIKKIEVINSSVGGNSIYVNSGNILHYTCLDNLLDNYAGAVAFSHPCRILQVYKLP